MCDSDNMFDNEIICATEVNQIRMKISQIQKMSLTLLTLNKIQAKVLPSKRRIVRPKKVVSFSETRWVKTFLTLTPPDSRMYIGIYIFNFKKQAETKKGKTKKQKKLKKKTKYLWQTD